jgi:CheY-like chemotaxis protein
VGSAPSILIIDQSSTEVASLKRAFSNAGVANPLYSISSGPEAQRYLSGEHPYADRMRYPLPSVILLDVEQTGSFELLSWIREKFPSGGLLIVALTRLDEIHKISRAYSLGANSFLTKPVHTSELQELITIFNGYWLLYRLPLEKKFEFVSPDIYAYDS